MRSGGYAGEVWRIRVRVRVRVHVCVRVCGEGGEGGGTNRRFVCANVCYFHSYGAEATKFGHEMHVRNHGSLTYCLHPDSVSSEYALYEISSVSSGLSHP